MCSRYVTYIPIFIFSNNPCSFVHKLAIKTRSFELKGDLLCLIMFLRSGCDPCFIGSHVFDYIFHSQIVRFYTWFSDLVG